MAGFERVPGWDDSFSLRQEAQAFLRAIYAKTASDQSSEGQSDDYELKLEQASGDGTIDYHLQKLGIDPDQDVIAALRNTKIGDIATSLAEDAGIPPNIARARWQQFNNWKPGDYSGIQRDEFIAWAAAKSNFQSTMITPFLDKLNIDKLTKGVSRFRVNRSINNLVGSTNPNGIMFEAHGQGVMAIMKMGLEGSDLQIAGYTVNHPEMLAELERKQNLTGVTVTTHQTSHEGFDLGVYKTLEAFRSTRGMSLDAQSEKTGYTRAQRRLDNDPTLRNVLYKYYMYEHYKIIAANLNYEGPLTNEIRERQAYLLGSANFTSPALGSTRLSLGGTVRSNGSNIENTVFVHHGLVSSGVIEEELFDTLISQSKTALERIQSRTTDLGQRTFNGSQWVGVRGDTDQGRDKYRSRILTNTGYVDAYRQLLGELAVRGGEASLSVPYKPSAELLDLLTQALKSDQHVRINIVTGGGHEDHLSGASSPLQGMSDFWESLKDLTPEQRSRLNLVQSGRRMAHSKSLYVALGPEGNREHFALVGSTNFMKGMVQGSYVVDGDESEIKNIGQLIYGGEWAGLNVAHQTFTNQIRGMGILSPFEARQEGLYRGLVAEVDKHIEALEIDSMRSNYGISAKHLEVIKTGNIKTKEIEAHIEMTIGGQFKIRNDKTGRIETINLGKVTELTFVKNERSEDGQWFIPELSKSIGEVLAISSGKNASKLDKARVAGNLEVAAGGVYAVNRFIENQLQLIVKEHGIEFLRRKMQDPVFKSTLRRMAREKSKQVFEHFAGLEPGISAYGAKAQARLAIGVNKSGLLQMLPEEQHNIGALQLDAALSGLETGRVSINMEGAGQVIPMAGSLSSRSKTGTSPARLYDFSILEYLPMSGLFRRKDDNGNDVTQALILMPGGKISQLAQRGQTALAARNLSAVNFNDTFKNEMEDYSRLSSQKDAGLERTSSRRSGSRGVKLFGIMAAGLTGDNAYAIDTAFAGQYFGNEAYQLKARINTDNVIYDTLADITHNQLNDLFNESKEFGEWISLDSDGRGKQALITEAGLKRMDRQLRVAEHRLPGGRKSLQVIQIADKARNIMIDLTDHGATRIVETKKGDLVKTIAGQDMETAYSGMRFVIQGKFPINMIQGPSQGGTTLVDQAIASLGNPEMIDRLTGGKGFNVMFGTGVVKSGTVMLETGAELLATGVWREQLNALLKKNSNSSGVMRKGFLGDLTEIIANFHPYMDVDAQAEIKSLLAGDKARDLRNLLEKTQIYLEKGGTISLTSSNLHRTAAATIAFGIHAQFFLEHQTPIINQTDDFNKKMSPMQLLAALPVVLVSPLSSTATPMSSRNRVNFMAYHSGGYTDDIFDLMSLDKGAGLKESAFQELLMGGLMESKNTDEMSFGKGYDPLAEYFTPGYSAEMHKIYALTRKLQGFRTKEEIPRRGDGDLTNNELERIKRDLVRAKAKLQAKVKEHTRSGWYHTFISAGSDKSFVVNEYLSIQEKAGIGSRTLLVPRIGHASLDDIAFDLDHGSIQDYQSVRLMSPKALKSLGSFSDYSHELQVLQVQVERLTPVLNRIMIGDRLRRNISETDREAYMLLMSTITELKQVQQEAVATDLQKTLGGQLAMPGTNMIAGVHPEIPNGYMVLGDDMWANMKARMAKELWQALRTSEGAKMGRPNYSEALTGLLQKIQDEYGVDTSKKIAQLNETTKLRNSRLALAGMKSKGLGKLDVRISLGYLIGQEEAKLAKRGASGDAAKKFIGELLEDRQIRDVLSRGVFQRSGAPMGPMGLVVTRILTVNEFNDEYGHLMPLSTMKGMQKKSMFIFSGAMGFNLGDFDGDTASIANLANFSRLTALSMINAKLLTDDERIKLSNAQESLGYSTEELGIKHARYYTGMHEVFNDALLYNVDPVMRSGSMTEELISNSRKRLHELVRLKAKNQISDPDLATLEAFERRKTDMYNRAMAFNKFTADIHETDLMIREEIVTQALLLKESGLDNKTALERGQKLALSNGSFRSVGIEKLKKHLTENLITTQGTGSDPLTYEEAVVYFNMTSLASTVFMGKIFEVEHASVSWAQMQRGKVATQAARNIREVLAGTSAVITSQAGSSFGLIAEVRAELNNASGQWTGIKGREVKKKLRSELEKFDRATEKMDQRTGIALVFQQMARDAIKPKIAQELRSVIQNMQTKPGEIVSAAAVLDSMERIQAMKLLYTMSTGRNFDLNDNQADNWADVNQWGNRSVWTLNDQGQRVRIAVPAGDLSYKRSEAFETLKSTIAGFHSEAAKQALSTGTTYKEYLQSLYGSDFSTITGADLVAQAHAEVEKARAFIGASDLIESDRQELEKQLKQVHYTLLSAYIDEKAGQTALETMMMADAQRGSAIAKREYNNALEKGNLSGFYSSLGGEFMAPEDITALKMNIIAADSSRTKLNTGRKLQLALSDLFQDFSDQEYDLEQVRELAESTGNARFAKQIVSLYGEMDKGSSFDAALSRVRRYEIEQSEADMAAMEEARRIAAEKKNIFVEGLNKAPQMTIQERKARVSESRIAREAMEILETPELGRIEAEKASIDLAHIQGQTREPLGTVRDETVALQSKLSKAMSSHVAGSVAANIVAPTAMIALTSSTVVGISALAGFAANATAAMIAFGSTRSLVHTMFSNNDKANAAFQVGILGASLGASVMGGKLGARMGESISRLAGHLGAGIGGFIAGAATSGLLESMAEHMGYVPVPKPSQVVSNEAYRRSDAYRQNDDNLASEVASEGSWDDDDDSDLSRGYIRVLDAAGDFIQGSEQLFPIAAAAYDIDEYESDEDSLDIATDPDNHIGWVSFEGGDNLWG